MQIFQQSYKFFGLGGVERKVFYHDDGIFLSLVSQCRFTGEFFHFLVEFETVFTGFGTEYTATTNIALILCIAPLITALLLRLFYKDLRSDWTSNFLIGSILALTGVSLVILNGHFVLRLSPKGDLLCLASAVCWALYTVFLKDLEQRYSNLLITRKVFFYGTLTILPLYASEVTPESFALLAKAAVWGNLLYLGLAASLLCFLFWNLILHKISPIRATNYIYFSPVVTAVASYFILGEPITWIILAGGVLIISGVWLAGKKTKRA